MNLSGYFLVQRKALESWLWELPAPQFKVAMTILAMANWKQGKTFSGGEVVTVERGELMTSLATLSERSGESTRTIRTTIANLSKAGFLTNKSTKRFRLISITNYETYQDPAGATDKESDSPATKQRQSSDKAATMIEAVKQGNRETKKKKKRGRKGLNGYSDEVVSIASSVLGKLNERLAEIDGRRYEVCKSWVSMIAALVTDPDIKATEHDLRLVVWDKANEWGQAPRDGAQDMRRWIRPETLFRRGKFPGYLVAARAAERKGQAPSGRPRELGDLFGGAQ